MAEKDWIARYFVPLATYGAREMRDDAGLLRAGSGWKIATTDALVEGIHVLPDDTPYNVAKKLVRVNVSDLLAKGALPFEALLTLGWPKERGDEALADFAKGLAEEFDDWAIGLVGGDTVASPTFFASLTLIGSAAAQGADPVWQSGAKSGERVLLSGPIGGMIGLKDARTGQHSRAAEHYRVPQIPDRNTAILVSRYASASTDVSDGLLGDLSGLLRQSGCGGAIDLERVRYWRNSNSESELLEQCTGGDDYQIVCTASPQNADCLMKSGGFYLIGETTDAPGLKISFNGHRVNLPETLGFEHGS